MAIFQMKSILMIMAALFCSTVGKSAALPTDTITTADGGTLHITFFGHASLGFESEGKHIYNDPVAENGDYSTLPRADVILVGHEHGDHFDAAVIKQLSTSSTILVGSRAVVDALGKGEVLAHGEARSLSFVTIEAVAAYNTGADKQGFHPRSRGDNGYILTFGGTRVYVAGDSEPTPEMLALKDIDIAFLPVNQPYTMTEEQAARVVKVLRPKIFYPYHYGQVEAKTDLAKLGRLIADVPTEIRIRPLE
jgi:L-ascorbate metabolism protein UlaG (beta-lactamase superfamily)